MAYVKAVIVALLAALTLGAAGGAWGLFKNAVEMLRPEDKAAVYSRAIAEAMNCGALLVLLFVPAAVIFVAVRRRGRSSPGRPPGTEG